MRVSPRPRSLSAVSGGVSASKEPAAVGARVHFSLITQLPSWLSNVRSLATSSQTAFTVGLSANGTSGELVRATAVQALTSLYQRLVLSVFLPRLVLTFVLRQGQVSVFGKVLQWARKSKNLV